MIDVDAFPSDTSWLSEPTTGVHHSEEVHFFTRGLRRFTAAFLAAFFTVRVGLRGSRLFGFVVSAAPFSDAVEDRGFPP